VNKIARISTDATGTILTLISGNQFMPSWNGLQFVVNDNVLAPVTVTAVNSSTQMTVNKSVGANLTVANLSPNRETVYQAFFNLIKNAPGVVTASRTPRIFSDVGAEQCPFMFLEQMGENAKREGRGIPYNWDFDLSIGILCKSSDPDNIPPATLLNPILDALELMLPASPTSGAQTLDGLVNEARLIGNGHEAAGAIAANAWAFVPARITVV